VFFAGSFTVTEVILIEEVSRLSPSSRVYLPCVQSQCELDFTSMSVVSLWTPHFLDFSFLLWLVVVEI